MPYELVVLVLQCPVHALAKGFEYLYTSMGFVIARDQRPGGLSGAGVTDHLVDGHFVVVPFFPITPVIFSKFMSFMGLLFPGLETSHLFVLADVYPKL